MLLARCIVKSRMRDTLPEVEELIRTVENQMRYLGHLNEQGKGPKGEEEERALSPFVKLRDLIEFRELKLRMVSVGMPEADNLSGRRAQNLVNDSDGIYTKYYQLLDRGASYDEARRLSGLQDRNIKTLQELGASIEAITILTNRCS
jgi:hypothetical protein